MAREMKFRALYNGEKILVETIKPKHRDAKGYYKSQGYIKRLVKGHPYSDKRGYILEHRLIMECSIGRILHPNEIVHHKDQDRENNYLDNLELKGNQREHLQDDKHLVGKRNSNGQFISNEPIFSEIKFRLYNKNTKAIRIYTLASLIGTTFRRGQFEFRGRWTGLKDKNGKEIYEGDIVKIRNKELLDKIIYDPKNARFRFEKIDEVNHPDLLIWVVGWKVAEVIGNIYENPELLENKK